MSRSGNPLSGVAPALALRCSLLWLSRRQASCTARAVSTWERSFSRSRWRRQLVWMSVAARACRMSTSSTRMFLKARLSTSARSRGIPPAAPCPSPPGSCTLGPLCSSSRVTGCMAGPPALGLEGEQGRDWAQKRTGREGG